MDALVAIARIVKPRGIKGEVAAELLTDFPERFEGLDRVTVNFGDGTSRDLEIEDHWLQAGRIVIKFNGFDSIDESEKLRDAEVCVAESDAVELGEGEYYDWQLAGCAVRDIDGSEIGTVRELMRNGGTEILVVDGTKEYLIPFAAAICVDVDIENKQILVDPPEGLLEF